MAMALANPDEFVLKPQREGGGKMTSAYLKKGLVYDVLVVSECSLRFFTCLFDGIPTTVLMPYVIKIQFPTFYKTDQLVNVAL